jgi:hypothetical protein
MRHHAYLIVGAPEAAKAAAWEAFALAEDEHIGSPDIHALDYELFGIDEARLIMQWASQTPVARAERIFIISAARILHETQNALLKLFEEPPRQARFALIVGHGSDIIPTLRSRFAVIEVETSQEAHSTDAFYALPTIGERMAYVTGLAQKEDGGASARAFIDAIERDLYSRKAWAPLREVEEVQRYAGRRGSSLKMLLEHLVLSLPQIKA